MDFDDSPEEAAFRAEVRQWIAANAPTPPRAGEIGLVAAGKAWQAKKFDAGYAAITWPKEYGGRDGTAIQALIYGQEEGQYAALGQVFGIGLGMCLPIVRTFGTAVHRERYLRRGLRGEEIWCQLFSEPSGGSDVAASRTKAVRDGDEWVVNGQKIWTSGAHYCDFGILLVRTDPTVPKHKGLTMFIVNMKAPGVTTRPIKQLNGQSDFNEVFFDDVRIPDSDRLGAPGEGWHVAVTTLMHERNTVGGGIGFVDHDSILELSRRATLGGRPAIQDSRVRERIADLYLNLWGLTLLNFRAQTALSKGATPGPEQSVGKVIATSEGQRASYLAMDLLGEAGILTSEDLGSDWDRVGFSWSWGAAMRIAGGSDEILRNVIAERVLGLPQDVRVDKDVPFNELLA